MYIHNKSAKQFYWRSKITWGWGTTMRNLGVPFSYFFRKLGVPSKNKNLSCYYLFAKKENN